MGQAVYVGSVANYNSGARHTGPKQRPGFFCGGLLGNDEKIL